MLEKFAAWPFDFTRMKIAAPVIGLGEWNTRSLEVAHSATCLCLSGESDSMKA